MLQNSLHIVLRIDTMYCMHFHDFKLLFFQKCCTPAPFRLSTINWVKKNVTTFIIYSSYGLPSSVLFSKLIQHKTNSYKFRNGYSTMSKLFSQSIEFGLALKSYFLVLSK